LFNLAQGNIRRYFRDSISGKDTLENEDGNQYESEPAWSIVISIIIMGDATPSRWTAVKAGNLQCILVYSLFRLRFLEQCECEGKMHTNASKDQLSSHMCDSTRFPPYSYA